MEAPVKESAMNQSIILRHWAQERMAGTKSLSDASQEMVEMLHRCLESWRKVGVDQGHEPFEALDLFCLLDNMGISTYDHF